MRLPVGSFAALIAILSVLAAGCATRPPESGSAFGSADRNGDGKISQEELREDMKQRMFSRVDRDRDGWITQAEWLRVDTSDAAAQRFIDMDADKSGRVSLAEFSAAADKSGDIDVVFLRLDQDRSGDLSPDEFSHTPVTTIMSIRF